MRQPKPLNFPHKQIRARVIAEFVRAAGYQGVVVFTCGNAAKTLRDEGLSVTEVGPRGDLKTDKWWTIAEIHRAWPDLLDATSGHLTVPLMGDIAKAYLAHLGDLPAGRYSVPSGSGETVTCLRIAYPLLTFDPSYNNDKPETTRHPGAPLNAIVDADSLPESEEEKIELTRMMNTYGRHVTATPASKTAMPQGNARLSRPALFLLGLLSAPFIYLAAAMLVTFIFQR
jgi:hypothetical protein